MTETNTYLANKPGAAEQIFRFMDDMAIDLPACQPNLACLLEFDLASETLPSLEALRNFIKEKLPELPSLTSFLDQEKDSLKWSAYEPDLDKIILGKEIPPQGLMPEIQAILKEKIPRNSPWKLRYLTGYAKDKFALLWCVRHEVFDAGGLETIFQTLFGKAIKIANTLPSLEKASQDVPAELLSLQSSVEATGLFWKNVSLTTERKIIGLQMPADLLSKIGKAFNVSANDIYLKAIGEALWEWRHNYEAEIPKGTDLPLIVPVNLRQKAEKTLGNRFYAARYILPRDFSAQDISKQTDIFRTEKIRKGLSALQIANPDLTAAQCPSAECLTATCSSFRITDRIAWGKYPLSQMVQVLNASVGQMPLYTMFITYAPKAQGNKPAISNLFFSLDAGLDGFSNIPELWKEAIFDLAEEAEIDLREFGEEPIQPFSE